MSISQTDSTDAKIWEEKEWSLKPYNTPLVVVPPPEAFTGEFKLVTPLRRRKIDTFTHKALLEQSLRDYKDIWRTLAER